MPIKKAVLLAGGSGSRLFPLTEAVGKHLQRVYDKPMIYYPLSTLLYAGVRDICVVASINEMESYKRLFGDGAKWGLQISYADQAHPRGIADGLMAAADFISGDPIALILGDNLFHGSFDFSAVFNNFTEGAHIFAQRVKNPKAYGIITVDKDEKPLSIVEKPASSESHHAVTGLYLYDSSVLDICRTLKPSRRGELEITDVNAEYLKRGKLSVSVFGRGMTWLDLGTVENIHEAGSYVRIVEVRQGVKIGCLEELALRKGFIDLDQFKKLLSKLPPCEYRVYLKSVLEELRG